MIRAKLISFTAAGARLGEQLAAAYDAGPVERYAQAVDESIRHTDPVRRTQQAMVDCDLIVFIGEEASARALIAPFIRQNGYDPAVLALSEDGCLTGLLNEHKNRASEVILRCLNAIESRKTI